jgi:hypothetical protein
MMTAGAVSWALAAAGSSSPASAIVNPVLTCRIMLFR